MAVGDLIQRWTSFARRVSGLSHALSPWDDDAPIRGELFSVERLEAHARSLAMAHVLAPRMTRGRPLNSRLVNNGSALFSAYRSIVATVEDDRTVTPAAEWLIDNYHVVEKQLFQISTDLPPRYYRQLPKLLTGPFAGYPRVLEIVWAYAAHTDSGFDADTLVNYINAYQQAQPLTIGELWAASVTLQIVFVENLRRLAHEITRGQAARRAADAIADRLLGVRGQEAEPASAVFAKRGAERLPDAFIVQLEHRLRDQDPKVASALAWLDDRLLKQGATAETAVRDVHRSQTAANVTVRNLITSLRVISEVDWKDLFERTCLVDRVLSEGSQFGEMDFATRTLYRNAVEQLARRSRYGELDVARLARDAAREPRGDLPPLEQARRRDCGYFLLGGGRRAFEETIGLRHFHVLPAGLGARLPLDIYAVAIATISAILLAIPLIALARGGVGAASLCSLAVLGAIGATDAGLAVVNRLVTRLAPPSILPGMELGRGVPEALRTMVVVPTLLTSKQDIADQIERLQIHYLASPDGDLHFALLSDWTDADAEAVDGDAELASLAQQGLQQLNLRYGPAPGGPRFLLLHRRRLWNESEHAWIGWERKRGKLHELNRFLRGAKDTTFIEIDGVALTAPENVKYVVTLDSDTRVPRDAIRRLIGKMAHRLNQPRFDAERGRVVEGYAVLQPRVTPSLPKGGQGSLFQTVFSSSAGLDPYASAVSEVYQDVFGDGTYAGKGIYDVDAFEAALCGRTPDSCLLSHDLYEGIHARAGFASDIEIVEECPARYDVSARRRHRWARGDWQLLPWIVGIGPTCKGAAVKRGELTRLGRWKMIDNLRRTLRSPSSVLGLMYAWTLSGPSALVWTVFVLATMAAPPLIPVAAAIFTRRPGVALASHVRALGMDLKLAVQLIVLDVTFLADEACLMSDAIVRTLWRLFVSRRHLLEWTTTALTAAQGRLDLSGFLLRMAGAMALGVAALTVALLWGHGAWPWAAPLAALWFVSPAVARHISLPTSTDRSTTLSDRDRRALRRTARLTWRFFEAFVTADDQMLPPDNFQEDPTGVLAHRTSPTNIGLYLLSVVSAHDFGWITKAQAMDRLEATLATLGRMERFRGHFYNWYDTRNLHPLEPRYVSSVDSGNLVGHLLALVNVCSEWKTRETLDRARLEGVRDMLELTQRSAARRRSSRVTQTVTLGQLEGSLAALSKVADDASTSAAPIVETFDALAREAETLVDVSSAIALERSDGTGADLLFWSKAMLAAIRAHRMELTSSSEVGAAQIARLTALEDAYRSLAMSADFSFLFDVDRQLLSIGFLISESKLDSNCYDLLASEARLASFVAIAKGDIPARHWFRLGRSSTPVGRDAALLSWSGSMFEYLMPALVMSAPTGSLLDTTDRLIVRRQIEYGAAKGIPWGVSESAYNARDLELTYQYSNFGVPGLGLKRGLGENSVVAPYASALAAMFDPVSAVANGRRLAGLGARGRYGFYEAIDFTPSRVQEGKTFALVRNFMAHHQGMTIVAMANAVFDGVMRSRFHAEPLIQSTELLLQERVPREVALTRPWASEIRTVPRTSADEGGGGPRFVSPHLSTPATLLLSNGRYTVMLTGAGSGYSRWGELAITRWREDTTRDASGSYIFLRDVDSGDFWSAGYQPVAVEPDEYTVQFHEDHAEILRRDGSLNTKLEVLVSTEEDAEVRRVTIVNSGARARDIEITSYAELTLGSQAADVAHPAFAKLFVETDYVAELGAIIATRRKRAPSEPDIWAAHLSVADGEAAAKPEFETDRARFLGRGRGGDAPIAMMGARPLSNTVGRVLDPIFALRRRVRIAPRGTARVAFWTMAATSRAILLDCIDKHRDGAAYARATTLAWTQGQVQLHHLGMKPGEAALFQRLAGHILFADRALRPISEVIRSGSGRQSGLWSQGISGDLPIVLVRIAEIENLSFVHHTLQAYEYWRMKQLAVDLVFLNERKSSYVQDLQVAIETLVRANLSRTTVRAERLPGRIFTLRTDLLPVETIGLLLATARVVLTAQQGRLADQLARVADAGAPARLSPKSRPRKPDPGPPMRSPDLEFFNGLGGFADNGREYVTILTPGQSTPAPWINVVANPTFGFLTSVEGGGYTWSGNSRETQLTPWSNDPVADPPGEAVYIRDPETGDLWCPTALPIRDPQSTYIARFRRGEAAFEHSLNQISSTLTQFVPVDGAIKVSRLRLINLSKRARALDVVAYAEWVLGPSRTATLSHVETEIDAVTGAAFASNPWSMTSGSGIAFLDMRGAQLDMTCDRREFLGRNGSLARPAALDGKRRMSGRSGAALDPCAAMRTVVELPVGGEAEVFIFLGEAATREDARATIARYRAADLDVLRTASASLWETALGAIQIKTPDRSMDIMINGWLLYQTLACRLWARSGFYQASGAYGFRDQLQDVMALTHARPDLAREHLLRAAARQFLEGDVQHWWLPQSGQGVRTRISDDRPWLAFVTAQYVEATGDNGVLDEPVPFLDGVVLAPGQSENFFAPTIAPTRASLFDHCALALDRSLALGSHGLPLMGAGDWNDGMNRVGEAGQGESVWLGWFLLSALTAFACLAAKRNDHVHAEIWTLHADALKVALEREAWDGEWYMRAFFDDGTPLGSSRDKECRIDSIAQSWAVLSRAAAPGRAARAMASLDRELIRRDDGLALLFAPPFDDGALDPGYIKGYPPGVRENGGQYTHAAVWSVMAFAALGDGDRAAALFAMLNPVNHSRTRADVHRYKVEPFVVAADIYSMGLHVGRGGWTWYTGSAGWLQRAGVESLLGLRFRGPCLEIDPCIPAAWDGFEATLTHKSARYHVTVENPAHVCRGVVSCELDGGAIPAPLNRVPLVDDGARHEIRVLLG